MYAFIGNIRQLPIFRLNYYYLAPWKHLYATITSISEKLMKKLVTLHWVQNLDTVSKAQVHKERKLNKKKIIDTAFSEYAKET